MNYKTKIDQLKNKLEEMGSPARLDIVFSPGRAPTQAFSEFLTNKEQGDWAEKTFIEIFNKKNPKYWAVKYGKSEDLIAGEEGFDEYYEEYQQELGEIGKRPDLLIFERDFFREKFDESIDISNIERFVLDPLVKQAVQAIEVRSSAFISEKYAAHAAAIRKTSTDIIIDSCNILINDYPEEILQNKHWAEYAKNTAKSQVINMDNPRAMSRSSTSRLSECSQLTKEINRNINIIKKRDFLSITPKAEDLSLVYKWISIYNVPHYYCQVFFDQAIIISFEDILTILANPEEEEINYFIEKDEKNQGKVTFKINIKLGKKVMDQLSIPKHFSAMRELPKGRLLFYVKFESSSGQFVEKYIE
jgi:type II restriction enzyme